MTHEDSKPDFLGAEFALWKSLREVYSARGFDLQKSLRDWSDGQIAKLETPGAQDDFSEICSHGCLPEVLAATVVLLRSAPNLESLWTEIVGNPAERLKAERNLSKTAAIVERLGAGADDATFGETYNRFGHLSPTRVAGELRFYVSMLKYGETLKAKTKAHSLVEVSKFLLTSYVYRMTKKPHDRNVSALIASATAKPNYDEVSHRMWRSRNYKRLEKDLDWITRILAVATIVLALSE
jgi:hypothetical protein